MTDALWARRQFLRGAAVLGAAVSIGACQRGRLRKSDDLRELELVVDGMSSADGAGVKLHRTLGSRQLSYLDPFLLLDEIHSDKQEDWMAGFPAHPHRGFETVSYLIAGSFEHKDSVGNSGIIGPGDCQWMTAGRGIIHSEMPRQQAGNDLWGLQLWVNLPAAKKMQKPRYQDMSAASIPEISIGDAQVRVATGKIAKTSGPIDGIAVKPTLLEVTLEPGASFRHSFPAGDSSFVQGLSGELLLGPREQKITRRQLAVLGKKGRDIVARSDKGARFLLISAQPIGEPVARRGPFVMNTDAEIRQAFEDYRNGVLTGS